MQIKAEFYRWGDGQTPDWAANALADKTIITDGDGDAFLVSGDGTRLRINSGDYLMQSMSVIFLITADVYEAMVATAEQSVTRTMPAPHDLDAPNGLGEPPYSPTVLARSARAREKQAAWDQKQAVPTHIIDGKPAYGIPPGMHPFVDANGPENAHVEGADVPDEPELTDDDDLRRARQP